MKFTVFVNVSLELGCGFLGLLAYMQMKNLMGWFDGYLSLDLAYMLYYKCKLRQLKVLVCS